MTPGTVRRMTLAVGLGLLLALARTSTVALAQGGSPPSGGYAYTVQPGDSWLTLSGRTNIPIADLKAANPAAQHPYGWLWQGERLFIPARTAPTPGRQASPTPSATAAGYWYQVQKGDTWQTVARASGVPMLDLWHANPLQLWPNRWLYIGHGFGFQRPQLHQRLLRQVHRSQPPRQSQQRAYRRLTARFNRRRATRPYRRQASVAVTATTSHRGRNSHEPAIGIVVTATKPTAPPPTSTPPSLAGWPAEVLTLINEKRVSAGVPALVWSPVLAVQPRPMPTTALARLGEPRWIRRRAAPDPARASGLCGHVGQRDLGQGSDRTAGVRDVVERTRGQRSPPPEHPGAPLQGDRHRRGCGGLGLLLHRRFRQPVDARVGSAGQRRAPRGRAWLCNPVTAWITTSTVFCGNSVAGGAALPTASTANACAVLRRKVQVAR